MNKSTAERQHQAAQRRTDANAEADTSHHHPLLNLQQQVGNAQIARMIAQRETVDDLDEDDEDSVAQLQRDPALQRATLDDDDDDDSSLQRSTDAPEVGAEGGPVSDAVASSIDSKRGGGSALDDGTRGSMEGAFGTDFSAVRLHTDSASQQLNRSLGARAFTTGNDIFFGPGGNPADKGLLAHELTHVVQQRSMNASGPMTVGAADDRYEREAESTAASVSAGSSVQPERQES
jgi:hypothetical protein